MVKSQPANRSHGDQDSERWLAYVGDCPKVTEYINDKGNGIGWAAIKFAHALFRGYGQAVFANNPFSGVLVMIALLWADFAVGLKGLFSSVIALAVSIVLRYPKEVIENGLTVFNPLILGQVCGAILPARFGIEFELQHWFMLALGSIFTLYVASALTSLLGSIGEFPIPCLALPFCVVQFLLFITAIHLDTTTIIPTSLNNTSLTPDSDVITLPSANGFDQVSAALERQVFEEETSTSFQLSSIDLNTIIHDVSTPPIQTSTSQEKVVQTQKANMKAEVLKLHTTTTYMPTTLTQSNTTELVTVLVNTTHDYSSITNQTLEKNTRRRRSSESDSTDNSDKEEILHWGQVFAGIILSMTQVFGACHVPGAVLIYLAVLIYSPVTAGFSLVGAIVATVAGIGLSTSSYALVYEGFWGFNGLLTAAALSFFYIVTWQSMLVTIISVLFCTGLQNLLMISMAVSNLPVVSLPFNLTTILFLCLAPDANGQGLIRPRALSFPEKQRVAYLQQRDEDENAKASILPLTVEDEPTKERRAPLAEQEVV